MPVYTITEISPKYLGYFSYCSYLFMFFFCIASVIYHKFIDYFIRKTWVSVITWEQKTSCVGLVPNTTETPPDYSDEKENRKQIHWNAFTPFSVSAMRRYMLRNWNRKSELWPSLSRATVSLKSFLQKMALSVLVVTKVPRYFYGRRVKKFRFQQGCSQS